VKGRKRHLVVDSQGSVLGVWVSPADVSDARGAHSFAWILGCRRLSRCYDGLCEVEACWMEWACVRWLVRRMAKEKKC
jgi:transposase